MNKSLKERSLDPFVQAHRRSPEIFLIFFKKFESQMKHYQRWQRNGQLCVVVEYALGTSLHDEDVEEFLSIKTPQWICEGVLEEQVSLMKNIDSYFKKWREWRNTDLGNKSSTSIKGEEKDEVRDK